MNYFNPAYGRISAREHYVIMNINLDAMQSSDSNLLLLKNYSVMPWVLSCLTTADVMLRLLPTGKLVRKLISDHRVTRPIPQDLLDYLTSSERYLLVEVTTLYNVSKLTLVNRCSSSSLKTVSFANGYNNFITRRFERTNHQSANSENSQNSDEKSDPVPDSLSLPNSITRLTFPDSYVVPLEVGVLPT